MSIENLYEGSIVDEKRKYKRFEIEVPVRVEVISERKRKKKLLLRSSNVSAGGIYIHMRRPLPVGTEVKMDIFLLHTENDDLDNAYKENIITVTGQVIRKESGGVGIRFNQDYKISSTRDFVNK